MLRTLIQNILFLSLAFSLFSCASRLKTPNGIPDVSVGDYENMVETKTKKVEVYDGLYNKLTVQATWLDSQLSDAGLSHSARLSQWSEAKYKEEKTKRVGKNAEGTEFFLSFYTPERKHNDLTQNKNLWKTFLDVNGQRYEGKVTKVKLLLSEIQALYPHHNRWSTPYLVSFPVPTGTIENKEATFTITGAVGSAQIKF